MPWRGLRYGSEREKCFLPRVRWPAAGPVRGVQEWAASWLTRHLKFIPGDAAADPRPQSFCRCFFGGKAGRETFRAGAFATAIGDLIIGENAAQKTVAIALDRLRDALNLDQIHAGSD